MYTIFQCKELITRCIVCSSAHWRADWWGNSGKSRRWSCKSL